MKLVFDIEADAVDASCIWMLIAQDIDSDRMYVFSDHSDECLSMEDGKSLLSQATHLIGHNIIGYDLPVLKRLAGFEVRDDQTVYDTWVMSQTLRYKRNHKHGLAGWGEHLGHEKIFFDPDKFAKGNDPEVFQEMLRYCKQDVRLNTQVYNELLKEFQKLYHINPLIREGLRIEHDTAHFNAYVRERGWKFDMEKANENRKRMAERMEHIEKCIEPQLGTYTVYIDKEPRFPKFKKNGEYTAITARQLSEHFGEPVAVSDTHRVPPGESFQRTREDQIKLGQADLVKDWLLKVKGWTPDDYTVKKIDGRWVRQSPKFTQTSLAALGELGEMISEYYTIRNRASVLDGWLSQVTEGRLHGNMWTIGTPTFRVRHEVIVNLPGVHTPWGKELRELLVADEGMVVVGADSSGNQLRGLAHYVGDDAFTNSIVAGSSTDGTDAHSRNANILGCSRSLAKNYLYAYMFGAGFAKLGSILTGKPNPTVGKTSAEKFGNSIKGLANLKSNLTENWKRTTYQQGVGWFYALDGRPVFADSDHQCLNYLLQATEGITCKAALSYAMEKIREEKLRAEPRLFYHDEQAWVSHPDDADRVGEILQESFREAPKKFNVNIMDGGDYVKGESYADVH